VLLFVLATAYGVSVRQYSNDVWISLASGRHILTHGQVPKTDPFSYTFADQPWFNQNWLSHLSYYWLYDRISPGAVVVFKWAVCAGIFVLVLLAGRFRSRSWLAALIAASLVAVASRQSLLPRPEVVGLFCLAWVWAVLAWLAGASRRWWPAVLLCPALLLWGCAHGSFVFGYGMIGLFAACWLVTRAIKPTAVSVTHAQLIAVVLAAVAALLMTVLLGPYGLENFTHPLKVAASKTFRGVSEWQPAYVWKASPPVWPFWTLVALALLSTLVAWLAGRAAGRSRTELSATAAKPATSLFDVISVAVGFWMAFWARRFGPLFYIVAAPAVLTWLLRLACALPHELRIRWRGRLARASWLFAGILAMVFSWQTWSNFFAPYADHPELNLLQRSAQYEALPTNAMEFLQKNKLAVNLFTHWPLAGAAMFCAPDARVFIDGRSQQVYDERHYNRYRRLWIHNGQGLSEAMRILDQSNTEAVLLMPLPQSTMLLQALAGSGNWTLLLYTGKAYLYLRSPSDALARASQLERRGQLWWPDLPEALLSRANLLTATAPPDPQRALAYYRSAVSSRPALGLLCYPAMTKVMIQTDRTAAAAQYLREQTHKLNRPLKGLDQTTRRQLLDKIDWCKQKLAARAVHLPGEYETAKQRRDH